MSINQLNNEQLTKQYHEKLLNRQIMSQFITIPQTTINEVELFNKLKDYKQITYLIVKLEQHKDEGLHIHIVLKFKSSTLLKHIHKIIMSFNDRTDKNGTIDYQTPKSLGASIQYLKKEETSVEDHPYLEHGEAPNENGRPLKKTGNTDDAILEALQLAKDGNTDAALESIKQSNTRDYLLFKNQIKETLLGEKQNKKWTAPNMNKDNVTLSKSQKQVWDLIQQPPKARRIIWITGDYGSGKSYLKNYIENNYEYGTYDAGQSASLDNVAYAYNEEGAILWDLPRTYNFNELGDAIANVIEKFSDFGTKISSKKYNGKTTQVLGHTIVFSNHDPINQLKHRDIIHIHLDKQAQEEDALATSIDDLEEIVKPKIIQPLGTFTDTPENEEVIDVDDTYHNEYIQQQIKDTSANITNEIHQHTDMEDYINYQIELRQSKQSINPLGQN
jgi:hypothetical protein